MGADIDTDDLPPRRRELEIFLPAPVEYQGRTHLSVKLREPTAGEWADAGDERGFRATAKLMALVSGVPMQATLRFPVSAAAEADRFFAGFLLPARPTPES